MKPYSVDDLRQDLVTVARVQDALLSRDDFVLVQNAGKVFMVHGTAAGPLAALLLAAIRKHGEALQ